MKILGDIGQRIAQVLEAERGNVRISQLNDLEGVHLVYDVARLAESELYSQDTRGWDTGGVAQSTTSVQTITGLPPIFSILGMWLVTDNSARVSEVSIKLADVGAAGSTRDNLLWWWRAGDTTTGGLTGVNVGDSALATMLVAPESQRYYRNGDPVAFGPVVKSRQGAASIDLTLVTTAFGAGTVRVTGHIAIGFFRRGNFLVAGRPFS